MPAERVSKAYVHGKEKAQSHAGEKAKGYEKKRQQTGFP
jgi:hypothetical protein